MAYYKATLLNPRVGLKKDWSTTNQLRRRNLLRCIPFGTIAQEYHHVVLIGFRIGWIYKLQGICIIASKFVLTTNKSSISTVYGVGDDLGSLPILLPKTIQLVEALDRDQHHLLVNLVKSFVRSSWGMYTSFCLRVHSFSWFLLKNHHYYIHWIGGIGYK